MTRSMVALALPLLTLFASPGSASPFSRVIGGLKGRVNGFVPGRLPNSSVLDDALAAEVLGIPYEQWDAELRAKLASTEPKSGAPKALEDLAARRLAARLLAEAPMPVPRKLFNFYPNLPTTLIFPWTPMTKRLGLPEGEILRMEVRSAIGLSKHRFSKLYETRAEALKSLDTTEAIDAFAADFVRPRQRVDGALARLRLFAPSPTTRLVQNAINEIRKEIVEIEDLVVYARHALEMTAEPGILWSTSGKEDGLVARMLGLGKSAWRELLQTEDPDDPAPRPVAAPETPVPESKETSPLAWLTTRPIVKPYLFPFVAEGPSKPDPLADVDSDREGRLAARAGKKLISYFLSLEKLPPEEDRAPLYTHFAYRKYERLHELLFVHALKSLGLRLTRQGRELEWKNVSFAQAKDAPRIYVITAASHEHLVVAYHRVVRALDHLSHFQATFLGQQVEYVLAEIASHIDPYVRVMALDPEDPRAKRQALALEFEDATRELQALTGRIDAAFVRAALAIDNEWVRRYVRARIGDGSLAYAGVIPTRIYQPRFTLTESLTDDVRSGLDVDQILSIAENTFDVRLTSFARARVESLRAGLVADISARCEERLAPIREAKSRREEKAADRAARRAAARATRAAMAEAREAERREVEERRRVRAYQRVHVREVDYE